MTASSYCIYFTDRQDKPTKQREKKKNNNRELNLLQKFIGSRSSGTTQPMQRGENRSESKAYVSIYSSNHRSSISVIITIIIITIILLHFLRRVISNLVLHVFRSFNKRNTTHQSSYRADSQSGPDPKLTPLLLRLLR